MSTSTDLFRLRGGGEEMIYLAPTFPKSATRVQVLVKLFSSRSPTSVSPSRNTSISPTEILPFSSWNGSIDKMANLPKFDDLPNKMQYWPAAAGSEEEGLGMLRLLTPEIVADAARTQIQTGERVCLNWDIENLTPPGNI